jgi:hypothetical protein
MVRIWQKEIAHGPVVVGRRIPGFGARCRRHGHPSPRVRRARRGGLVRRPGHRAGVDGARVHRDDEPLPAPPRHPRRPGRSGASQRSGARRGTRSGGGVRMTKEEPRPTSRVCAGRTGFPSGGAEGIRTPDLLIAKATWVRTATVFVLWLARLTSVWVRLLKAGGTPGAHAFDHGQGEPKTRWRSSGGRPSSRSRSP